MPINADGQRVAGRRTKQELTDSGNAQRSRGDGSFVDVVVHGTPKVRYQRLVRRADGSQTKITGTGGTRDEARRRFEANYAIWLRAQADGEAPPRKRKPRQPTSTGPTFLEVAHEWLAFREQYQTLDRKEKLGVQAANQYRLIIKNYLTEWGSRPITAYTSDEVSDFTGPELQQLNLSNSHARTIQGVVFQIFHFAWRDRRYIAADPAEKLKMLKRSDADRFGKVNEEGLHRLGFVPDRIMAYLAPDRAREEFSSEAAWRTYQRLAPYEGRWALSALLAMRPAEVTGLTWDRITYLNKPGRAFLTITQQLARNPDQEGLGTKLYIKPSPKTAAGIRNLPISEDLREILLRWKTLQAAWAKDERWEPYPHLGKLVFTTRTGKPLRQQDDSLMWSELLRAAFPELEPNHRILHLRQYALRHLAITRMLRDGQPVAWVAEVAGHTSVMLTQKVYGHLKGEDSRQMLEEVAAKTLRERRRTKRQT